MSAMCSITETERQTERWTTSIC